VTWTSGFRLSIGVGDEGGALDGFRLPSMETVEACADQGWLVRLEGPPFFRASEAGRTIVWQAGAFG
jgi:hypothetical protein